MRSEETYRERIGFGWVEPSDTINGSVDDGFHDGLSPPLDPRVGGPRR